MLIVPWKGTSKQANDFREISEGLHLKNVINVVYTVIYESNIIITWFIYMTHWLIMIYAYFNAGQKTRSGLTLDLECFVTGRDI